MVEDQRSENVVVVTIDGPSGAGKGTICRLVANACGYALLDSGSLYRLTALSAMQQSVDLKDELKVAELAARLPVKFQTDESKTVILLDGKEVSSAIREEEVGMGASVVAAHNAVRSALLDRQKAFAQEPGLVADGRDMGTVVFPDAPLKIFLTASAEERAKRRCLQIEESGKTADYGAILADVKLRDERDSTRSAAPLKPAGDAILLDSTAMSIDDVFSAVMRLLEEKQLTAN